MKSRLVMFLLALAAGRVLAATEGAEVIPHRQDQPPNKPYSPQEARDRMSVPAGFRVELVASEPGGRGDRIRADGHLPDRFRAVAAGEGQDVSFGKYFVGGLSVRLPWDQANPHQTHLNSAGLRGRDCEQQRAAWCTVERPLAGGIFGIAVFDRPANPNHPAGWRADEQGLINPNVSALGDWSIPARQERVFRYRLAVYRGSATPEQLATRFAMFAGDSPSAPP